MYYLPVLVLVSFAILFYRIAVYERMAGWAWATMSVGVSSAIFMQSGGLGLMIAAQSALFVGMWAYNAQRRSRPKG